MAATNFTPIQLYHSTTASAAPTAGNLVNGELAINILDGKLYYKDNGGVVQVIATKGTGTIGGSTTQVQYNNTGALAGSANFTFDGTTATINTLNLTNALGAAYGGTAQSTYAQGDLLYASAANTLAKLPIGISTYILTSNGTIPGWSIPSSVVIGTATNLAGGAAGSVPYQSGASTTAFLSIGTVNQVITSTGSAPQWSSALTLTGLSNSGLTTLDKTVTVGNTSFNGAAVFAPATPAKVYLGTGTVTDVTSAIAATNAAGAIVALGITPIAATNANVTYTNASTLYIAGAPSAGTNITITNPYALYVAAGDAYFGASVSATTLDLTNLEVTNIKAKDGTASMTLADSTGVVTFSANPVLNAGTANGVPYLSSPSKVLTTGSALVFDGTNLGIGTNSPLSVSGYTFTDMLGSTGAQYRVRTSTAELRVGADASSTFVSSTNSSIWFGANNAEVMRLTSTGLGIGTNNPAYKLQVADNGNFNTTVNVSNTTAGASSYARFLSISNAGSASFGMTSTTYTDVASAADALLINAGNASGGMVFAHDGVGKMTLDSSGNLGLGVTPSAWSGTALQVLDLSALSATPAGNTSSALTHAAFWDGTNWRYTTTNVGATRYQMTGANAGSTHSWSVAAGGTANSASVADTKSYTVVALGTTTLLQWQALFSGLGSLPSLGQVITATATGSIPNGGLVTQNISFTQAMTLLANGNLGVGETNPAQRLHVASTAATTYIQMSTSTRSGYVGQQEDGEMRLVTSSSGSFMTFQTEGVERARISSDGTFRVKGAGTAGSTDAVQFSGSAPASSLLLDSSGNFGLGVTPSAWFSTSRVYQFGSGGALEGRTNESQYLALTANQYIDSAGARKYIGSTFASLYQQYNGKHEWFTAPSGTAGNPISFTQAMTLDASGKLLVGNTVAQSYGGQAPISELYQASIGNTDSDGGTQALYSTSAFGVDKGSATVYGFKYNTAGNYVTAARVRGAKENATDGNFAGYLAFDTRANGGNLTERARITAGGYFKASDNGTYFGSTGTYHELNQSALADSTITRASNASYASSVLIARALRSQNSAYNLIYCDSGDGADAEFKFTGDGNGYADGTFNNNGADYAEYFESATGDALTVGATVVLDGNKVREATTTDPVSAIMGVVRPKEPSKASMVIGNTAWNKWANKYLTDDFDRYIMEDHEVVEWTDADGKQHSYESHNMPVDVTAPADAVRKTHDDKGNKFQHYKLNPAWNSDAEYTPREKRPEWNIIGLVGQVKVLKGKPVNDRWIKMRDVSASVEEWMIR